MNYRSRGYRPYRRRMRGIYGFPWIFVILLIVFTQHWEWLIAGVFLSIIVSLIIRAAMKSGMGYQQQQPYYQAPYQPPQQNYQSYQQESQPYQQGYQPVPQNPQTVAETPYPYTQTQEQAEQYQEYEQPRAEYPQQMPPM